MVLLLGTISALDILNTLWPVSVIIGAIVAVALIYKSTLSKENNELKDDLIDTQRKKIENLEETTQELKNRDDEQQKMLDELKKDLDTWKNLPIRQLADDYHKLTEAVMEMSNVLRVLVEEDGGLRKRNSKRSS